MVERLNGIQEARGSIPLSSRDGTYSCMDTGLLVYILSRLILGALAAFLAIMLWSRTRDVAWILIIIAVIAIYAAIVYDIMRFFGFEGRILIGSMSLMSILLPCLPIVFIIATLAVMVARKYRGR